jgi:hypothetical protein
LKCCEISNLGDAAGERATNVKSKSREQGNKKMTRHIHNLQMHSYFGVSSELVTVKVQSEHFKEKQKIIALV